MFYRVYVDGIRRRFARFPGNFFSHGETVVDKIEDVGLDVLNLNTASEYDIALTTRNVWIFARTNGSI